VASWSVGHYSKERTILVRTTQEILELDQTDHVLRTFKIPTEADRRSLVQWYGTETGQAFAVFTRPSAPGEPENISKQMVYRVASSGAIEDQFELGLQAGGSSWSKQTEALGMALLVPAPLILFVVDLLREIVLDGAGSLPAAFRLMLAHSGPSLLVVLVLSLILAIMAWRRCGAYGLSRQSQFTWAIFVLLLGVPAYVGFLLSRRWPVREKCPSCRTEVPRDRTECARCGSLFPEPALQGIEIFA
jgi:hypothetical protein